MKKQATANGKRWIAVLAVMGIAAGAWAGDGPLWQIGVRDNRVDELALAPNGYGHFGKDAVFVVGKSGAMQDWPYCQPGPDDPWAKLGPHTFTALFELKNAPDAPCHLILDLADTHATAPPRIAVAVNGKEKGFSLTPGTGDVSIFGDASKGKEQVVDYPIPPEQLKAGLNRIAITTLSGSWLLYDGVEFQAPKGVKLGAIKKVTALQSVEAAPALIQEKGALRQLIRANVLHIGSPSSATLVVEGGAEKKLDLQQGEQTVDIPIPPVEKTAPRAVRLLVEGKEVGQISVTVAPARKWEVYLLHHTHLDIGYTHVQSDVEKKQWEHLDKAIELARASKDYPDGSKFKWLPEGLWAVDSYVKQASPEKKAAFIEAVNQGWIGLDALYGSELSALCRPEELLELTACARRISREVEHPIDSAMITDVPGYTWGLIPVLAQSGVKYFSIGPNPGHRIGTTLTAWGDKPFYWLSPSGQEKVLCWVAAKGYAMFHGAPLRDEKRIFEYLEQLGRKEFPYDMTYLRYNIGGDNGPPDAQIADVVRAWNEKYAYPKLILALPREFFEKFEQQYGKDLPQVGGDFTPYWEDGAASTARETAINRDAAEKVVQANALWAMLHPPRIYPAAKAQDAWRDIILYDEHTWGAHNSISEPEADFVKSQWAIKQAFALEGARKAQALAEEALGNTAADKPVDLIRVYNTLSWTRTNLVTLPASMKLAGDCVKDSAGGTIASQRLASGALVFVAKDVPAFGARLYRLSKEPAKAKGKAQAKDNTLSNGLVTLRIDPASGAVSSLKGNGVDQELTDISQEKGLNAYVYVAGRDPKNRSYNGASAVKVLENGPLVAAYRIEAPAPGCRSFQREVRVVDGLPYAEIVSHLDRENVYAQEGAHLAFPFNVPQGIVRLDTPWAVTEIEKDQIPGSCKEYQTVQRWVDVSNADYGVTWAPIDAPMIEIGEPTTGVRDDIGKRTKIGPSTLLYSYVMNNYWETNYKASQEGLTSFRYAVRPHTGGFDAAQAARFGMEQSSPLLATPVQRGEDALKSRLTIAPDSVIVTDYKPSDDGQAWIVRFQNLSPKQEEVRIERKGPKARLYRSDVFEKRGEALEGAWNIPSMEFATVRIEPENQP